MRLFYVKYNVYSKIKSISDGEQTTCKLYMLYSRFNYMLKYTLIYMYSLKNKLPVHNKKLIDYGW